VGTSRCGRRTRRGAGWRSVWILAVAFVAAGAATAEIVVPGDRATLRWTAASGPVQGYEVWVSRNGAASAPTSQTTATEATLTGAVGDVVRVSVRAFTRPGGSSGPVVWGPLSAASEAVRFGGTPPADPIAILDCPSCARTDFRLLPSGTPAPPLAHPPGGVWDLVHVGNLVAGADVQVAYRERTNGALLIGDYLGDSAVYHTVANPPDFQQHEILGAGDFEGDGVDDILERNLVTGALNYWSRDSSYLTRVQTMSSVDPAWDLIGIRDLDGDGAADLWFDNHRDEVWVYLTINLLRHSGIRIQVSLPDFVPTAVADYDGDGVPDVLLRSSTGALTLGLLRGNPTAPWVEFRALPRLSGDDQLEPRASVDLDGIPGAEILLQTSRWSSGTLDAVYPMSGNPAQRRRLLTTDAGSKLVQVVR
jgi:hypothetical protein